MKIYEALALTRDILRDNRKPYLFSDASIVALLSEAQARVAQTTHYWVETEREMSLEAGEDVYALDADVLLVQSVRIDGYTERLLPSTEAWTPDIAEPARPSRYTTNIATRSIRFYAPPDAAYTALLRVAHRPPALSPDDLEAEIPLPEECQSMLPDWAAYRCLVMNDADGLNEAAAERALTRYMTAARDLKRFVYRSNILPSAVAHGHRVK